MRGRYVRRNDAMTSQLPEKYLYYALIWRFRMDNWWERNAKFLVTIIHIS
jgi:hypothetical protein